MPEQQSKRGQEITTAPITNPFETAIWPYGQGGLDLNDALDAIPVGKFARHTNVIHTNDRAVTGRPGLTSLATGGTNHHSVRRLADPQNSTYTRIWGTDQDLRIGQSGALSIIDTGYSGAPLYLLPARPPLSGDPWMFVGDISRMRKVRFDGLDLPIGLPAPGSAPTLALASEQRTMIAGFDPAYAADGTQASNWTLNGGFDFAEPPNPVAAPTTAGNSEFIFNLAGSATCTAQVGWYASAGIAVTRDLSQVGSKAASDDDIIFISIRLSAPAATAEVRLYLVCSPNFDATVIPGTDPNGRSSDFFMKSFRPDDFALAVVPTSTGAMASEAARIQFLRDQAVADQAQLKGYGAIGAAAQSAAKKAAAQAYNPERSTTEQAAGATVAFKDFGIVGVPLRRGDFRRFGQTANCDWNTITGLFMVFQGLPSSACGAISVALLNWGMTGGSGPDTIEPGAQPYDYRVTHYDPRTGAEGNPSPEMVTANAIDSLRRGITVDPVAYGDAAVRQRIYRRGGSLITDWFFCGTNSSDGGVFLDELSDDEISTAGSVNLDHYEPVPTVDDTGATVLAQPVPVIFGPANGLIFGLGDPYRPGHLYWCIPDQPDHWPAESNFEVCSPSEQLMAGFMIGAQPFCFSRERLFAIYPNLSSDQEVTVTTTACKRGIVSRWAFAVGLGGVFACSKDAIFVTAGGAEEVISQDIDPLFKGKTVNGYPPIDFSVQADCRGIRLTIHQDNLYFLYPGTDGCHYCLVYSLLYKWWLSFWSFTPQPSYMESDMDTPIANLLLGGLTTGKSYLVENAAFSDDGSAITSLVRTGTWDLQRPREDKLLGDQIVDADPQGVSLVLQNRLDNETIVNAAQAFAAGTGRKRYVFDSFGTTPQRARNISTDISWSSSTARPTLYFLGQSIIPEPDVTVQRVTQWDDLGHPDESYLTGITLDVDTAGATKTILVERDYGGAISTVATLSVTASGRHKLAFSWSAAQISKVRLRPTDSAGWIVYRADWISLPEPPRIAAWDIHFEAAGDQYHTGLDLYCDTGGLEKQIVVTVDGTTLTNPYTGEAFWRITANGRRYLHLTFEAGRGHVYHFHAIDANPGVLYSHKWYLDPEPSEQYNWNQNFSILGSRADKYLKAVVFECDTFGVAKSVQIQADGVNVETLAVQADGRKVVQIALTTQQLGRVWRMYPVDANPGRLYSAQPVFDEEPFCLTRWETQESDFDLPGFSMLIDGQITLKSSFDVTLTISTYASQTGLILSDSYVIPSTDGVKSKAYVPFLARKGVLHKFVLTADQAFWLYKEESSVQVLPWGGSDPLLVHPFGNSDNDRSRSMQISELAAARSGGGSV